MMSRRRVFQRVAIALMAAALAYYQPYQGRYVVVYVD